jgi:F-type H+-transporting ATPase subunit gamma
MESIQHIKSRLGAVENIGTITRAMEVVSATKMRKAQGLAISSRPYAFAALSALASLLRYAPGAQLEDAPLVKARKIENVLLVLVASDRGLAGSFNSQVTRVAERYLASRTPGEQVKLMLVGKKLSSWAAGSTMPVEAVFTGFGDYAEPSDVTPLSKLIIDGYRSGSWDKVVVISSHFKTTLNQITVTRELVPMHIDIIKDTVREIVPEHGRFAELREQIINGHGPEHLTDYLFEPTAALVLDSILPRLFDMQLFHLILEANASEHSARMVAMKNASENAGELSESLSLQYNKARQASITKEMIEITSAIV